MPSDHRRRGRDLDDPNHLIPWAWQVQAGRRESYEATVFQVHHAEPGSLPYGLLKTIAEMHHQGPGRVCPQRNP